MTAEETFLYRYERLGQLLEERMTGGLLDIAAILRQFLIDGMALVDVVNRRHRLQIVIAAPRSSADTAAAMMKSGLPEPWVLLKGDLPDPERALRLNRNQYLQHTMITVDGQHLTVRQIIKACANRLGGVHVGDSKDDDADEAALRMLNEAIQVGGAPAVFRVLYSICAAVHEGLQPLYLATKSSSEE